MNEVENNQPPKIDSKILNDRYKLLNSMYPDIINKKTIVSNRIVQEIQEALNVTRQEANDFCKWYRGVKYQVLLVEGANRYSLKGEIIGQVTKEEENKVKSIIEKRKSEKSITI
jgi:sRNA-binding protein